MKARGGTYQASLEPLASITCERIGTLPPADLDRYVEDLNDVRTLHGTRRVSARQGWAGEKGEFFSVLLVAWWFEVARRAVLPRDGRLFGLLDEATQINFRCTE